MKPVLVSVVMPIYNGERFLPQAIDSILSQSLREIELIVIDDGSTDKTASIVESYLTRDTRIRILRQGSHQGLVPALNRGIAESRGRYIARMDADDISIQTRFSKQIDFLEINKNVSAVGTGINQVSAEGALLHTIILKETSGLTTWLNFFICALAHPSVMMRRECVVEAGEYRADTFPAEDFDLWMRLGLKSKIANLPEVLLDYRVWSESISAQNRDRAESKATECVRQGISKLTGLELTFSEAGHLRYIAHASLGIAPSSLQEIERTAHVLQIAYHAYAHSRELSKKEIKEVSLDVAIKYVRIAQLLLKHDIKRALSYAWMATRLNPSSVVITVRVFTRRWLRKLWSLFTQRRQHSQ